MRADPHVAPCVLTHQHSDGSPISGMSLASHLGMNTRVVVSLLLALTGCGDASGDVVPPAPPCEKCTLDVPPSARTPVPLLVVMHGNHEDAADAARRWREAARARNWAVLSLHCPRGNGCEDGKWYQWKQTPEWVTQQVAELGRTLDIDETRLFLAGWSGGATAIGKHATSWDRMFAAVVFHGGGQPPPDRICPAHELPAYFLVGDENPAHPAAKRLRGYYESCGQEYVWDLVPGANHAREDQALDREKAIQILDWLDQHARRPNVS